MSNQDPTKMFTSLDYVKIAGLWIAFIVAMLIVTKLLGERWTLSILIGIPIVACFTWLLWPARR